MVSVGGQSGECLKCEVAMGSADKYTAALAWQWCLDAPKPNNDTA